MSRQEKVGAVVLGVLLFSGLFYFIFTTMRNPVPSDYADEAFFGDEAGDEDFDEGLADDEEDLTEEPEEEAAAAEKPAAAPAAPAAPEKKK